MILSWAAIIFGVVGGLLTLVTAAMLGFYFSSVPSGSNAMGLVVPFFTAIAAGLAAMIASGCAASRGGVDWLGFSRGATSALLVAAALFVGVAVIGALLAWAEKHALGRPLVLGFTGLLLPLGFLSFVVMIARLEPSTAPGAAVRVMGAIAGLAVVAGMGTAGLLLQAQWRKFSSDQARFAESRRVEQVEADRLATLTPEQKLRESLGTYSPTAPLWTLVAGLPDEQRASLRAILIERALQVPDFEVQLESTMTCPYGNYRHGCATLIAEVPPAALKAQLWAALLGREAVMTAADIRQAGDLGRHSDDPLGQHVATWLQASGRVERDGEEWVKGYEALRAAVAGLPASPEQALALQSFEQLRPGR